MIYIASDHGGFKLKESVKKYLDKQKIAYKDMGPETFIDGDDYPDYAKKVAQPVSQNAKEHMGILLCRSGQGMAIAANKFKGVRAGVIWNVKQAKAARNDDMTNVLCLPSDYITPAEASKIVKTWLATPYSDDSRHLRRVIKVGQLEK